MRAVRYYGPGDIRVEDVPEPSAKGSNIKIKVGPDTSRPFQLSRFTSVTLCADSMVGLVISLNSERRDEI